MGWLGARGTARGRRGRAGRDPDAWVRELEEETGAISITRYTKQGNTTAATAVQPGPSTLTARTTNAAALNALFAEALAGRASTSTSYPPDAGADANLNSENGIGIGGGGRKVLPAFFAGTYEEALRTCEREARVGCVVLVSEEHDDTREFKRCVHTFILFLFLLEFILEKFCHSPDAHRARRFASLANRDTERTPTACPIIY